MVLHLVQPSGRGQSRKRTASKDTSNKDADTASKGIELLCRVESLEEVMPDDCIEILTLEQEK